MQKKYLITLLLMISLLPAWAQTPYTLEEVLDQALGKNLNLKISAQDQELFAEQVREVKNNFLPNINLNATHQYYFNIPTQVAPASALGMGGEGSPAYLPLSFGLPHQTNVSLQLQQVIYNPQLPVGIKAAQTGQQIADLQLHQTKEEVVYNVSNTYYQAQSVAQQINLLKQNVASIDRLIEVTQLLYDNDLAKGTDVERLQLNQANLTNQLANLKVSYQQLLNGLKLMTNTPITEPFAIDTTIDLDSKEVFMLEDSVERTDVALAQKQLEVQQLEEKQIQAGYLPSLYATGVYGQAGFGEFDQDYYKMFPMSYVGLQLSVPLFDGLSKRSQRTQKQIQQSQTRSKIALLEQQVQNEIANAAASLQTQQQAVEIQQRALELAEKVYQNVQLQYKEGVTGVSEVIDSENELRQTQTDYLTAWVKLQLAALEMKHATGNLIE